MEREGRGEVGGKKELEEEGKRGMKSDREEVENVEDDSD